MTEGTMFGNGEKKGSFFERLKEGLSKTKQSLVRNVDEMLFGEKQIDRDLFEELEEMLVTADVGPAFASELIDEMKVIAKRSDLSSPDVLRKIMRDNIHFILKQRESPLDIPKNGLYTVMVVGVNGTGKTTTIGKIASELKGQGLAACCSPPQTPSGPPPSSSSRSGGTGWAATSSSRARGPTRRPSCSTPCRPRSQGNRRPDHRHGRAAPHEGQPHGGARKGGKRIMEGSSRGRPMRSFSPRRHDGPERRQPGAMFNEAIGVTGLVLTKLDGTAKGGIIIRLAREFDIPIRYIGIGEKMDDLRVFNSTEFVDALMG